MNILVSECLLGIRCKYSGGANPCLAVIQAVKAGRHRLIPVCPECLGGLAIPRQPSERVGDRVLSRTGEDVTAQYERGAQAALALAKLYGCTAAILKEQGINVRVLDMATIKPLDKQAVLKSALETGAIMTIEDHTIFGGLGSAVSEYLSSVCPVPVIRHGVEDEFGRSGAAQKVLEAYHLTAEGIAEKVRQAIAIKSALSL